MQTTCTITKSAGKRFARYVCLTFVNALGGDEEMKKSKWIIHENRVACSNCLKSPMWYPTLAEPREFRRRVKLRYHFCENCGAEMRQPNNSSKVGGLVITKDDKLYRCRCLNCGGNEFFSREADAFKTTIESMNYCPNCGAKF